MSVVLLKNSCEEKKESFARDSFQDSPEDKVEWSSNINKTTKQTEGFKEDIDWFNLSGINEDSILCEATSGNGRARAPCLSQGIAKSHFWGGEGVKQKKRLASRFWPKV